jgi:hypothetical protein
MMGETAGKNPPLTLSSRPWGASAAKIDEIFPCSALRLLLKHACRRRFDHRANHLSGDRIDGIDGTGGSRLPISWSRNSCRMSPRPPRSLKSAILVFSSRIQSKDFST